MAESEEHISLTDRTGNALENTSLVTGTGNERDVRRGCTSPNYSCAIALLVLLLALYLAFTVSHYEMASQPELFPNYLVPGLITLYEVVAGGYLLFIMCLARTEPTDDCAADADLQPWHRFICRNIKLFGIVPFFFAIFIFDFFRLIASCTCHDAWVACSSNVVYAEHITDLGYPVARTVYLFIELIFCVKFNGVAICDHTLVLVGLAIVQVTNISIWVDATLDESDVFSAGSNWTYEMSRCFNETAVNVSEHFVQCFKQTTGEYELLESASPYLYPFIVEYLTLVIECVFHWFFSNACKCGIELRRAAAPTTNDEGATRRGPNTSYRSVDTEQQPEQVANGASSSDTQSTSMITAEDRQLVSSQPTTYGSINTEQQRQKRANATVSGVLPDSVQSTSMINAENGPEVSRRKGKCSRNRCPRLLIVVVVSVMFSIVFVILGIYNFFLAEIGYLKWFMIYRIGYWVILSAAAPLGYSVSRQFPSEPKYMLNGLEIMVIVLCIGPIIQSMFTVVAAVETKGSLVPLGIFCTEPLLNLMQMIIQIVFYAYVKGVKIYENEADNKKCRLILLGVIWCFVVCNFALWVEDSFIETRSSVTSWQKQYFKEWPLIYNILNPLALVFRFNSALLFLNVLFHKRLVR